MKVSCRAALQLSFPAALRLRCQQRLCLPCSLLDAVVVADECVNHLLCLVHAQLAALVPANCVVVHIDLTQALHHVQLVLGQGCVCICIILVL